MRLKQLAFVVLVAIVTPGLAFLATKGTAPVAEKDAMLAIRWIGDQVLRQAGDSTSRVMPVRKISATVFQLEFQSQFRFMPDTLVRIVHRAVASQHLPLLYSVRVVECSTKNIIYGYRIGSELTTLVACLGREQPTGCYTIQIEFEDKPFGITGTGVLSLMAIVGAAGLAFVFYRNGRKTEPLAEPANAPGFMTLGRSHFSPSRRILRYSDSEITLTDKESRLLHVLAVHPNEVMDRDRLLKEVWEDDGVMVGRSLDVFISKLRKRMTGDPTVRIVNIHGKGYKLEVDLIT